MSVLLCDSDKCTPDWQKGYLFICYIFLCSVYKQYRLKLSPFMLQKKDNSRSYSITEIDICCN